MSTDGPTRVPGGAAGAYWHRCARAVCLALLLPVLAAQSAVFITRTTNSTGFAVSSNDLLQVAVAQTNDALIINVGENTVHAGGFTASILTNGQYLDGDGDGYGAGANADGSLAIEGGVLTYRLDTDTHPLGYMITSVETFSGWDNSPRVHQNYELSYARVSAPDTFLQLALVPQDFGGIQGTSEKISIFDPFTGVLASGVAAVRFDFGSGEDSQQNDGVGYKELDVIGTPVDPIRRAAEVPNHSFEDPVAGLNVPTNPIPGWIQSPGLSFIFYPTAFLLETSPLAEPAHSNQMAVLETTTNQPGTATLMTASPVGHIVPRYTYTLTAAVGHRSQTTPPREPDDYTLELLIRNEVVVSNVLQDAYNAIPTGGWVNVSARYVASEADAGGDVTIRISHASDDPVYRQGVVDNIRLTASPPSGSLVIIR